MRKYKINRTESVKSPSKEAMEKYKDFSRLSHEYDKLVQRPKKPLYQDKKMFLIVLLIALIAMLIVQAIDEDEEKNNEEENTTGWINPDSSNQESPFES